MPLQPAGDEHVADTPTRSLQVSGAGGSSRGGAAVGRYGGASMPAFDPSLADPALTIEYPVGNISQSDQKVGYLVITVHEDSGTFDGVQNVYNPATQL